MSSLRFAGFTTAFRGFQHCVSQVSALRFDRKAWWSLRKDNICELYRQQGWSDIPYELFYYRDRAGAEVDIIIETPSGVIGMEVKASTSVSPKHFKHLQTLRDRLGEQFLAGIVLNLANPTLAGRKLYSLPINSLWQAPKTH